MTSKTNVKFLKIKGNFFTQLEQEGKWMGPFLFFSLNRGLTKKWHLLLTRRKRIFQPSPPLQLRIYSSLALAPSSFLLFVIEKQFSSFKNVYQTRARIPSKYFLIQQNKGTGWEISSSKWMRASKWMTNPSCIFLWQTCNVNLKERSIFNSSTGIIPRN